MRATQIESTTVETKVTVGQAKVPESTTCRLLVKQVAWIYLHPSRHAIQIGVVEVPEMWVVDLQFTVDGRRTWRKRVHLLGHAQCRTAGGRCRAPRHGSRHRARRGVAHDGLHLHRSRAVPACTTLGRTTRSSRYTAGTVSSSTESTIPPWLKRGTRGIRHDLAAPRRLIQNDSVDRFVRRVEHAHGQLILLAGLDGCGHIEHERSLAPLVPTHRHTVDPDFSQVVHRPETQQITALRIGLHRRVEGAPVPGHAVIAGKRLLDDPRDGRRLRFRAAAARTIGSRARCSAGPWPTATGR